MYSNKTIEPFSQCGYAKVDNTGNKCANNNDCTSRFCNNNIP